MNLDHPKQYHLLAGIPILVHTVRAFINNSHINRIVVVVPADWIEQTKTLFDHYQINVTNLTIVAGGRRRQDSVQAGLKALDDDTAIVLVHDGARPLVSREIIDRCYLAALHHGAGIAAVPVKDTLKRGDDTGRVTATIDRTSLWQAQTPQAVRKELLEKAYRHNGDADVTDESSLLEKAAIPVTLVEGAETNIKITRPEDLLWPKKYFDKTSRQMYASAMAMTPTVLLKTGNLCSAASPSPTAMVWPDTPMPTCSPMPCVTHCSAPLV